MKFMLSVNIGKVWSQKKAAAAGCKALWDTRSPLAMLKPGRGGAHRAELRLTVPSRPEPGFASSGRHLLVSRLDLLVSQELFLLLV